MQKELAVFLKLSGSKYSNGLDFIQSLKKTNSEKGKEVLEKLLYGEIKKSKNPNLDHHFDEEIEEEENIKNPTALKKKTNESELTLKDIRDILINVNKRMLSNTK